MNIIVAVGADAASVGAKWMIIRWSDDRTDILKYMVDAMVTGGKLTYVEQMILADFCQIDVVDTWPYKIVPPTEQYLISANEPEYAISNAAFNQSLVRTEYERVSISVTGQVQFLADFKHAASHEGIIASYSLDIDDIKVA